jgi:uncharacterized protein
MPGRLAIAFVTVFGAATAAVRAQVTVPDNGTFVVDRAGVIKAGTETRLQNSLQAVDAGPRQAPTPARPRRKSSSKPGAFCFFGFIVLIILMSFLGRGGRRRRRYAGWSRPVIWGAGFGGASFGRGAFGGGAFGGGGFGGGGSFGRGGGFGGGGAGW